ncbi:MAG: hypothetical protein ACTTJ1_01195 [Treponema sp.]
MKKNLAFIAALFFCGTLFTSFSPSLDGRAVVADDGVLPKGIFAKTVGYLPGDSISVTNLTNKSTVEILVIGAIDPSEGIAILLSPEAALLLGVEKGSNSVVKITKRSGQLDEAVAGTAIIGEGTNTEEKSDTGESAEDSSKESSAEAVAESEESVENSDVAAAEESEKPEESDEAAVEAKKTEELAKVEEVSADTVEENPESTEENSDIPEDNADAAEENIAAEEEKIDISDEPIANTSEPVNENVEEEKLNEEPLNEEIIDEERISEPDSDDRIAASEKNYERVDDYLPDENAAVSEKVDGGELSDIEEKEAAKPAENSDDTEKIAESLPDYNDDIIASEKIDESEPESIENVQDDKKIAEADKIESREPVEESIPAPFEEDLDEIKPSEKVLAETLSENTVQEPLKDDSELSEIETSAEEAVAETFEPVIDEKAEEDSEKYEPIVLVPSNPNPPEQAKADSDDKIAETQELENTAAVPVKLDTSGDMSDFAENTVSSLKELERGKYYVQIAVLKDSANIKSIFDKYYGKYPITLVPLAGSAARQVLIGPLNVDEYGAVINRFKSYGYKDSFLRKIR